MNITAFAGSNSSKSINREVLKYALSLFGDHQTRLLDLNDFEMPFFSVDREERDGHPQLAHDFLKEMAAADLLIVSLAENNGSYTVAFKNILDWVSRIDGKVFQGKPMLLMSVSDGKLGGKFVMEAAVSRFPRHAAQIITTFSLPLFYENFDPGTGITEPALREDFLQKIKFVKSELGL